MTEVKYTEFAAQAVGLADIFNELFKKPIPGAPANYRVQLAVPDGPSTAGGKQGTQHIKLIPVGSGPTHVAGWANQADKQAEIRSWEYVVAVHRQRAAGRGGMPDEASYRKLVMDLKRFFEGEQFAVSVIAAPRVADDDDGPDLTPKGTGSNTLVLVAGIVGGLALVAVLAWLFLAK
ncbi:MAG TPA: hypothetical protein VGK67_16150 [Myxococcales bacterium]|jgi:hypothetical protein